MRDRDGRIPGHSKTIKSGVHNGEQQHLNHGRKWGCSITPTNVFG